MSIRVIPDAVTISDNGSADTIRSIARFGSVTNVTDGAQTLSALISSTNSPGSSREYRKAFLSEVFQRDALRQSGGISLFDLANQFKISRVGSLFRSSARARYVYDYFGPRLKLGIEWIVASNAITSLLTISSP